MRWLRRLGRDEPETPGKHANDEAIVNPDDIDADERAYELDLLKGEQERLSELAQRQLRYARYAWQPPAQGGARRADDEDRSA